MKTIELLADREKEKNREIRELESIVDISQELIDFVMEKYDVKGADDFTCPIHKRLYEALISYKEEAK